MNINEYVIKECAELNTSSDRWAMAILHPKYKYLHIGMKNSQGQREIPYKIRNYSVDENNEIKVYESLLS